MPALCLFNTFDWIPKAIPAERIVLVFDTGRKGERRYHRERFEVIDATHVVGRTRRWCEDKYCFVQGVWHVSQIDSEAVVAVRAYNADYSTLLEEYVKPGVMLPA